MKGRINRFTYLCRLSVKSFTVIDFKTLTENLSNLGFGYFLRHYFFFWLDNLNITPDFVSKANTVASLHSKECGVLSFHLRSSKFDSPDIIAIRLNCIFNLDLLSFHIVPTCLNQIEILRPGDLSIISQGPLLHKDLSRCDLMLVSETFFNESALVANWLLVLASVKLSGAFGLVITDTVLGLFHLFILAAVLANNTIRSLAWSSDLQHRMFNVDSFRFTILTEVVVVAD